MRLFLVRHGEARSETEDAERPLSERGRREIAQTAQWAARHGGTIRDIWHSTKRRAQQSAEILAQQLRPSRVVRVSGLEPDSDVWLVAGELADATDSLMLVSHMPFVSRLAGLLVARDPERSVTPFVTGAAALLARDGKHWRLIEAFAPDPRA